MTEIKIASLEGLEIGAYVALPTKSAGPVILVVHDVSGITNALKAYCEALATQGFIAVCPDMFGRVRQSGKNINTDVALLDAFDTEAGLCDLLSVLAHARVMKGCNGKVGTVGFGLGGRLTYLLAVRSDIDVTVSYYGRDIARYLDEIQDIARPILLHLAGNDASMDNNARNRILQKSIRNERVTTQIHAEAKYGFALEGNTTYDRPLAEEALKATMDFLLIETNSSAR